MKYSLPFLLLSVIFIAGCGKTNIPSPTIPVSINTNPTSTTSPTTTSVSVVSSTIDKNNPSTWPRFEFKELGMSIQLPIETSSVKFGFSEKNTTSTNDGCLLWGSSYSGVIKNDGNYTFIGNLSVDYKDRCGRDLFLTDISDIEKVDSNNYKLITPFNSNIEIHPIKILNVQSSKIIIFDPVKDFYSHFMKDYGFTSWPQEYAAAFKLPASKKFKATVIKFRESDINLDELIKSLNTIRFY